MGKVINSKLQGELRWQWLAINLWPKIWPLGHNKNHLIRFCRGTLNLGVVGACDVWILEKIVSSLCQRPGDLWHRDHKKVGEIKCSLWRSVTDKLKSLKLKCICPQFPTHGKVVQQNLLKYFLKKYLLYQFLTMTGNWKGSSSWDSQAWKKTDFFPPSLSIVVWKTRSNMTS